jgi:hypothetical protein
MKSLTPYQNADAIYQCWLMTLYLQSGIEKGDISENAFNKPLDINIEGKIFKINSPENSSVDTKNIAINLQSITLGTCFIALDEALQSIFGDKPKTYGETDSESLRAIIYMFRCSFAHTPATPKWKIQGQKYLRKFTVKEIGFEIDFRKLDGKELSVNHDSLWQLIDYCLTTIKNNLNLGGTTNTK